MKAKNKYSVSPGKQKLVDEVKKRGASKVESAAGFLVLDFLVGAALGGLTGAALGRWSLLAGAAINVAGNYWEQHAVSSFGVGMMASGFQAKAPSAATNGVNGTDDDLLGLNDAKERALAYGKGFAQKMWLDKFIPSLKPSGVNGLGEVQYFVYPNENPVGAIDMSALDRLESQVSQSAQQYAGKQQVSGLDEMEGIEGLDDDKIY